MGSWARPGPSRHLPALPTPPPTLGGTEGGLVFYGPLTGPCHPPSGLARWGEIQEVNKEAEGLEDGKEGGAEAARAGEATGEATNGIRSNEGTD